MQEFKDRLRKVCQDNPDIPLFNKGQQTFIAQKVGVSQEAVRKWFHGESKPKAAAARKLASLLQTDYLWLMMGSEHGEIEVKKIAARRQDSAVYAFMSYLIDHGHSAAFDLDDNDVDIVSIVKGTQQRFSVMAAEVVEDGLIARFVSTGLTSSDSIVAVRTGNSSLAFDFLIISSEIWKSKAVKKGNMSALSITNPSKRSYLAGKTKIPFYLE